MIRRFWVIALVCLAAPGLDARVTRIEITSRAVAFNGQSFGAVGQFEKIKGIASGEIDAKDRRNVLITDIARAPRNARGHVEYRTNFTLVKPVDMRKSSGVLFYNIVNRGNHGGPAEFHVGGDPGDGFLYKLGQAILWSGWQGDLPLFTDGSDHEGIDVPVARGVTGPVRGRRTHGEGDAARIGGPGWLEVSRRAVVTAAQNQITVKDQTIVQFPRSRRCSHAPGRPSGENRYQPVPLRRGLVRLRDLVARLSARLPRRRARGPAAG